MGVFGDALWPMALLVCVTGLLAPLMWHVVWDAWRDELPWRWTVVVFYAMAIVVSLLRAADALEWISWEAIDGAWMLAIAGLLGLLASFVQKGEPRRHLLWLRLLLALMILPLVGLGQATAFGAWLSILPDYLVLAFFCLTLYYRERVLFFDVVLRRGAYFAVGLLVAWDLPVLFVWLVAPPVYRLSGWLVDRYLLGRAHSAADVERQFWLDTQSAANEVQLREAALASLSASFRSSVLMGSAVPAGALSAAVGEERIVVLPRSNGAFWSEDERLLQSLARTYGILRENVRLREREQDLRLLASRAELRALRAQINPHFLFNSLNAIAGLIHTAPELADTTVEKLAEVFRYTLRRADQEWVRCDEELDFVQAYLAVQQARFGDRLVVEFSADDAAGAVTIPAMMIQPLIENAIVHGEASRVSLHVALEGAVLRIAVRDNGVGFPKGFSLDDSDPTHALRNIRDRLHGYYGVAASLRWESTVEGAVVSWELPV